jgi:hypothetical protein
MTVRKSFDPASEPVGRVAKAQSAHKRIVRRKLFERGDGSRADYSAARTGAVLVAVGLVKRRREAAKVKAQRRTPAASRVAT